MTAQKEDIIRITHRMMGEKMPYYRDSAKYLYSVMASMDQLELMKIIDELNIHELKQCLAAGVPGDAMHHANLRIKELKEEIKAYIDKKGAGASMTVEVEQPPEVNEDDAVDLGPTEKELAEGTEET